MPAAIEETAPATDLARQWEGWGTALKPAHEPVVIGAKPLTVQQHLAILLEYTTACLESLWSSSLANDAVESLSVTRARCAEVAASVLGGARTKSWESIGLVPSADLRSISVALDSPDPKRTLGAIALSHVRQSSNADSTSDQTTTNGVVADFLTRLAAISTSVVMGDTSPNTVSSWNGISADLLEAANTFTIETATRLTTALRTLSLSMRLSTSGATGSPSQGIEHRPIVMARKPLVGTVAGNVTRYGTGALNIDGTRIPADGRPHRLKDDGDWVRPDGPEDFDHRSGMAVGTTDTGRWPSNVLLSSPELFDEPNPWVVGSGATAHSGWRNDDRPEGAEGVVDSFGAGSVTGPHYSDAGGYSRFFIVPKSARAEREPIIGANGKARVNTHPTVKPVVLLQHLIRLVTPPGGTVLDCFAGSGTTGVAATLEGFDFILIEKEPEYVAIAEARLNGTQRGLGLDVGAPTKRPPKTHPDLSKHQPKRRAPHATDAIFTRFAGTDEEPAA